MSENKEKKQEQCQFFLSRKKRLCRFRPRPGEEYCPEHACVLGIHFGRKRIPCPLNPKHNCYEDDLQNHLRKCPVAKNLQAAAKLPYYVKDINLGQDNVTDPHISTSRLSVKELTDQKLREVITRVNALHDDCVDNIEVLHLEHDSVKEHIMGESDQSLRNSFGDQAILKKELLQQASLVGQIDNMGFLSDNHCYVELGAGKGKLSHWIQIASKSCTDNSFILVDRSSVRYKMDSYHKNGGDEGTFHRIKIDIKDLCLGKVPEVSRKSSVIVIGKHLCGGATDLGIRCAIDSLCSLSGNSDMNTQSSTSTASEQFSNNSKAMNISDLPSGIAESTAGLCEDVRKTKDCHGKSAMDNQTDSCQFSRSDVDKDQNIVRQRKLAKNVLGSEDVNEDSKNSQQSSGVKQSLESEEEGESPPAKLLKVAEQSSHCKLPQGIVIALCCHHQCTWDTYVGRDFMEKHDVSPEEFDLLKRLSSWATCARVRVKSQTHGKSTVNKLLGKNTAGDIKKDNDEDDKETKAEKDFTEKGDHIVEDLISTTVGDGESLREKLTISQREEIGRKCKHIIDSGRLHYLRSKGMTCFLREYVDEQQTPENIVLLAQKL